MIRHLGDDVLYFPFEKLTEAEREQLEHHLQYASELPESTGYQTTKAPPKDIFDKGWRWVMIAISSIIAFFILFWLWTFFFAG